MDLSDHLIALNASQGRIEQKIDSLLVDFKEHTSLDNQRFEKLFTHTENELKEHNIRITDNTTKINRAIGGGSVVTILAAIIATWHTVFGH